MYQPTSIHIRARRPLTILALAAALGVAAASAFAQVPVQDANDALATAQGIAEDPNCVTEAIASQAAAEGARRVGAAASKMLGKVGINTGGRQAAAPAPAANPCKTVGTAAAAAGPAGDTAGGTAGGTAGAVPAAPPVAAPAPTVTRPRLGSTNASGGRNCGALGAGCADGMKPMVACYDEKKGWLWKVLADSIEQKRDGTPGLAPDQLNDINADVAALRRAHVDGAPRVEVVDPARPDRYNTWLTGPEYSAAANKAITEIREHEEGCMKKYSRF
jgi:hypothetical protein